MIVEWLNLNVVSTAQMSNVIVLSDSDESISAVELNKCNSNKSITSKLIRKYHFNVADDSEFPKVQFCQTSEIVGTSSSQDENLDISVKKSDKLLDTRNIFNENINDNFEHIYRSYIPNPDPYNSEENQIEEILQTQKMTVSKKGKITLKEKQLERQHALARKKALKAIASKSSKDIKPGECLKFMEVNLDQGIDTFAFQTEIKSTLQNANIKFNTTIELIPNSITWKRNIEENYVDENNKMYVKKSVQTEQQIIVIWNSHKTVKHVIEGSFCTSILNSKALIPDCNMTLVIFGMEEYFAYWKKAKHKSDQGSGNKSKCNNKANQFETLAIISRQQLEMCLTEIQLAAKCSSRLIENAQDLALIVYQYTKSISEIPYKLQKRENLDNKFDWYVIGDNKNTVRVDKDGNGLKRLWQQQLCQFNLSSLEIAEAICTVYSSPAQLVQAYRNCTFDEGMNLLKDIPIRRAAGPLTTVRKVGPELSKKVYMTFTSKNGNALLGTEE